MSSFYSNEELNEMGFKHLGAGVLLSKKASLYGMSNIVIGNNVRIDDFCILSGNVVIGNNVHIAAGVYCFGGEAGIYMEDFVGVSSRTAIYAESDDYSGSALTNPTIPCEFRKVASQRVVLKKHVLIGTGCTILPGVIIGEGTAVGSMSLIRHSLDEWGVFCGIPCRRVKDRKKDLLNVEKRYLIAMGKSDSE